MLINVLFYSDGNRTNTDEACHRSILGFYQFKGCVKRFVWPNLLFLHPELHDSVTAIGAEMFRWRPLTVCVHDVPTRICLAVIDRSCLDVNRRLERHYQYTGSYGLANRERQPQRHCWPRTSLIGFCFKKDCFLVQSSVKTIGKTWSWAYGILQYGRLFWYLVALLPLPTIRWPYRGLYRLCNWDKELTYRKLLLRCHISRIEIHVFVVLKMAKVLGAKLLVLAYFKEMPSQKKLCSSLI